MYIINKLRIIEILIIFIFLNTIIKGQNYYGYIYTPEGASVRSSYYTLSVPVSEYLNNEGDQLSRGYNCDAHRIGDANEWYNCYGYAWYMSEGYPYYHSLDFDAQNFWSDISFSNDGQPSYIACSESEATHVNYNFLGHALRKIQNSYPVMIDGNRNYVSKWGIYGLYIHQKGFDPYIQAGLGDSRINEPRYFSYYKLKTTHSGTLANSNKTWIGAGGMTHSLSGNVTVPSGISLTIKSGTTIDFSNNNYYIISTGGSIILEDGVNFQGVYLYEEGVLKGLFPTIESALNIATVTQTVQTKSSIYNIQSTITIPSGKTLTINPGTILTFSNNSSLIVNGTLNAVGSSEKITFDFITGNSVYKNGIIVQPGASAVIQNSVIKNAYRAIDLNQAYANISGCEITGCANHAIYLYNTNYASDNPVISGCYIHDNHNGAGIAMYYSSPVITHNEIKSNTYGIGILDYSSPSLGYMGAYGYNHIYSNSLYGITLTRNSNPFLGENICIENGGHNSIEGNSSYNMYITSNCVVIAENNWWEYLEDQTTINTDKFYTDASSILDYYPPADPEDPARIFSFYNASTVTPGVSVKSDKMASVSAATPEESLYDQKFASRANALQANSSQSGTPVQSITISNTAAQGSNNQGFNAEWSLLKKLTYARYMLTLNRDKEAEQICKDVIKDYPDSSLSSFALDILWQSGRKNKQQQEFKDYLKLLKSKENKSLASLMSGIILSGFEGNDRVKLLDEIITERMSDKTKLLSDQANSDIIESAMFSKLLYYINDEKNIERAKEVVKEIDGLVQYGSFSSVEAHLLLGENITDGNNLGKNGNPLDKDSDNKKPVEYNMTENYPNPFNPETKISYSLPYLSRVDLRVFDSLGRQVALLVNGIQGSGNYNVTFNGSGLSSGLYIYKIRSQSLENKATFEKTGKMMMMK